MKIGTVALDTDGMMGIQIFTSVLVNSIVITRSEYGVTEQTSHLRRCMYRHLEVMTTVWMHSETV